MAVLNSFLSYLLLFIILVAIAVVGALLGIKLAKRKNAKMSSEQNDSDSTQE